MSREEAYDYLDRFLRNNSDDDDYALLSSMLELVWNLPEEKITDNGNH